jgi:hypothetical protein
MRSEALPIITIYFLGFKLSLKYAVIKSGREYECFEHSLDVRVRKK